MKRHLTGLFVGASLLAGCSLQPRYERPPPAVPPSWPTGAAYAAQDTAPLPAVRYQDIFRDARLQAIIERALSNNQDLRLAAANVAAARAQLRITRAQQLPQIDASANASFSEQGRARRTSGTTSSGVNESYAVDAGLSAFEIDLFGRLRSLSTAAREEYLGTQAAQQVVRLSLIAEIASAWATLATDRSLLAIARDTQASAEQTVSLTRARLRGGIAARTDLLQAQTIAAQARGDVADFTTLVAQDRNALELLVGAPVADTELPDGIETIDSAFAELPAGLDSRVLLRRPDVAEAEYRLRASNARIGAARAAFFPTISITGLAGLASSALGSLFTGDAFTWSAGAGASLPIFDGGARAGNLQQARAERDAALANYQRAIQSAFRDVADALARHGTIDARFAAAEELGAAAQGSYTLVEARYRAGIDPFLESLDAQRTLYSARRSLANARLVRVNNRVDLYRALGGDALVDVSDAKGPSSPVRAE
ncbi:efflux transporter outer membrane subunit [Sphingobium subterraneum]|uniref:Multidrug efflux system outer membrane protein n=1 Tax=Sphingobium subterraneum TaxID=627688 RepID=A0A841J404_9SPHN|nr:efflux transporter outer membrane subunit [Sphingobium subterraneum]MBB6124246.1 multidrug efflux system outer membrane protein [Sphingobium subterraneum]